MLSFRRFKSKLTSRQLGFLGKEEAKTNSKKTSKSPKNTMDNKKITKFSDFRFWNQLETPKSEQLEQFSLLSYNVLSQDLLVEHMQLYLGIHPSVLSWNYRSKALKAEILKLQPDILCLQEMQHNHLKDLLKLIDTGNKYEYIYKKKTGTRTDGCVIIYDRHKFKLLDEYAVEYYRTPTGTLNRENIAVIAKFCTKSDESKIFLVATTHLLFNPRREDVRTAQIHLLLSQLEHLSLIDKQTNRLPILLTGDFNFEPFTSPHELITNGNATVENRQNMSMQKYSHCLKLASAYGENCASTFQRQWVNVDYIFYSSNKQEFNIKIWSVHNLPPKHMVGNLLGQLPNKDIGSDHLYLAIKFSIEKRQ